MKGNTSTWSTKPIRSACRIKYSQQFGFDTSPAGSWEGSGFVVYVDENIGYVVTNRHINVSVFIGFAIFCDNEEVDLYHVYSDPVHDFAFLRFDPKTNHRLDVQALQLRPDLAKVGTSIRIYGNGVSRTVNISEGVISMVDLNAPKYEGVYRDFNTTYIQGATSGSPGSSGSPVVNIEGDAVAMQAGGLDFTTTNFYLPLWRVQRALRCLLQKLKISRGTIQCRWDMEPLNECRKLGMTPDWEDKVRASNSEATGMLVAKCVLPEGPSDNKIQEGDILLKVNGKLATQFELLEEIQDGSIGETVKLSLQRLAEVIDVEVEIGDLHCITPRFAAMLAGLTCNDLSYQIAMRHSIPCRGVYVSDTYKWSDVIGPGCILQRVNQKEVPDLEAFINIMKEVPQNSRIVVVFKNVSDYQTEHTCVLYVNHHWSQMRIAQRDDSSGEWNISHLAEYTPAERCTSQSATLRSLYIPNAPAAVKEVTCSFVRTKSYMILPIDGFPFPIVTCMGVVVDAEKGFVVVSRYAVPHELCIIKIIMSDSIVVDCKILFMHPDKNFAIVKYDPSLVQAPIKAVRLSKTDQIKQGDSTYLIGLNEDGGTLVKKTEVTTVYFGSMSAQTENPRYKGVNADFISLGTEVRSKCRGGVLIGEDAVVTAFMLYYLGAYDNETGGLHTDTLGLATSSVIPIIKQLQADVNPQLQVPGVQLTAITPSDARIMGVSDIWIARIAESSSPYNKAFQVEKTIAMPDERQHDLQPGDILLYMDGKPIRDMSNSNYVYTQKILEALIVRDGAELHLDFHTLSAAGLETDRVLVFCGAIVQKAHYAVRQQISVLPPGVYVSNIQTGSPASQYGLKAATFITAFNGVKTPDLESFKTEASKVDNRNYFRLDIRTLKNVPGTVTMKIKDKFFPMEDYVKNDQDPRGWTRT